MILQIITRFVQLFYELDVEMIKTTATLSGCCCVAAAYVTAFARFFCVTLFTGMQLPS